MKLYMFPASTSSRPVSLFCAEHDIPVENIMIDLMSGAHMQADYLNINPFHRVPFLDDDGFVLSESSAILKYLAAKFGSPTYPTGDLQKQARINERMDWFNTGFYMDYGYKLVYPQILPHIKHESAVVQNAILELGQRNSAHWLALLNDHVIGPDNAYVCGDDITIADYLGTGILTLGETIGQTFDSYPNVDRWLKNMKALPHWGEVHEMFDGWCQSMQGQEFVRVP